MGIRAKISEGMNYGNDRGRVKKATKQRGGKGKETNWKCISDRHPYAVTCGYEMAGRLLEEKVVPWWDLL